MIRFRRDSNDGGDPGCEGNYRKKICCAVELRRYRLLKARILLKADVSNVITRRSTAIGLIWRNPNWVSFRPSVSIAASRTNKPLLKNSTPGGATATNTSQSRLAVQRTDVSNSSIYTRQSDCIEPLMEV